MIDKYNHSEAYQLAAGYRVVKKQTKQNKTKTKQNNNKKRKQNKKQTKNKQKTKTKQTKQKTKNKQTNKQKPQNHTTLAVILSYFLK